MSCFAIKAMAIITINQQDECSRQIDTHYEQKQFYNPIENYTYYCFKNFRLYGSYQLVDN